jgi:hypothetical protein
MIDTEGTHLVSVLPFLSEANYAITRFIAEFTNTLSNLVFGQSSHHIPHKKQQQQYLLDLPCSLVSWAL